MPAIIWVDSDLPFDSLLFKCKIIAEFQTFDLYKMSKEGKMLSIIPIGGFLSKLCSDLFLYLGSEHFWLSN